MKQAKLSTYGKNKETIETIGKDPGDLVLALYARAHSSISSACFILNSEQLTCEDIEAKLLATELFHKHISKVTEIFCALRGLLDFEKGEPVASQLNETYQSILASTQAAARGKNHADLSKVERAIGELKSAWEVVVQETRPKALAGR